MLLRMADRLGRPLSDALDAIYSSEVTLEAARGLVERAQHEVADEYRKAEQRRRRQGGPGRRR